MTNANDPSRPVPYQNQDGSIQYDVYQGLTKREHFAAMAMQGILANPNQCFMSDADVAEKSIEIADELIEALNITPQ